MYTNNDLMNIPDPEAHPVTAGGDASGPSVSGLSKAEQYEAMRKKQKEELQKKAQQRMGVFIQNAMDGSN